jgi:hypothetical protein
MAFTKNHPKRLAIVGEASTHQNAHYLWGAVGNTPGNQDGAKYRPGAAQWNPNEIKDPHSISVWAARANIQGLHVCCGRFNKALGGISGGRDDVLPTDWDLLHYLEQLKDLVSKNQSDWNWPPYFEHYTPRYAQWGANGRTDTGKKEDISRKLVWGEDCRDIRHFDCIGFVNYVLAACHVSIMGNQSDETGCMAAQKEIGYYYKYETIESGIGWPGDIVTRNHEHIGILDGKGMVINAAESQSAVLIQHYFEDTWDCAPATPAVPATPATPATPSTPAKPAIAAVPAKPRRSIKRRIPDEEL